MVFARMSKRSKTSKCWRPIKTQMSDVGESTSTRHKTVTKVWQKYEPCKKATYVPARVMPKPVLRKLKDGRALAEDLKYLLLRDRVVLGEPRGHEQLYSGRPLMFGSPVVQGVKRWQMTDHWDTGDNNATPTRGDNNATPTRGDNNATPTRGDNNATPTCGDNNATPTRLPDDGDTSKQVDDHDPPVKKRRIEETIMAAAEATMIRAAMQQSAQDLAAVKEAEKENDEYLVPEAGEKTVNAMLEVINESFPKVASMRAEMEARYEKLVARKVFSKKQLPFKRWLQCMGFKQPLLQVCLLYVSCLHCL